MLIILFLLSSCGSYTKLEKHNQDMEELRTNIANLKKKEYKMKITLDSMSSQLMLLENQLVRIKKKLKNNGFSNNLSVKNNTVNITKTKKEDNKSKFYPKNKLTQNEILKITELSKKEEVEEPIVLTNSMLGTKYTIHKKAKKSKKHKASYKTVKNKKVLIKTMKIEYSSALKLYKENKFDQSITAFNNLIKKYSRTGSSLTDNFYYWLGENYLIKLLKAVIL